MDIKKIYIQWEGPFTWDEAEKLTNDWDYGIYQIYGAHPIYGSEVLLYIGKADGQTFGWRISQHDYYHVFCSDPGNLKVYVGRLAGEMTPSNNEWSKQINVSEKLLIISNKPATNSSGIKWLADELGKNAKNILVINLGHYKNILPEVFGERWFLCGHPPCNNYKNYGRHD